MMERKYLDFEEEELIFELDSILFDELHLTSKDKEEVRFRINSWIDTQREHLKELICTINIIKLAQKDEYYFELVACVFGALEAAKLGTATSPLAVLLCKRGIHKICNPV
jgi:hypothetical protein